MSSIAGLWDWRGRRDPERSCRAMLAAQSGYGRGSPNIWFEAGLGLAQAPYRSSFEDGIDSQPLVSGSGRWVLSADLRLDNRDEFVERLGLADSPVRTDAALLLLAVEKFGFEIFDSIVGDFAFALWDAAKRRLMLARDILGQRPLHFHRGAGFFAFASRPKALHALDGVARQPNERRLAEFIGSVPLFGSETFYEGIERVEPGHLMMVSEGEISTHSYWRPQRDAVRLQSFEAYREAFQGELDRAVQVRMRDSGPVIATHLSGGWDSSSVTATTARLAPSGQSVKAFTSIPRPGNASGAPFKRFADERKWAEATAAMYPNVEHVLLPGSAASPIADLDRRADLFDRPLYSLCNFVWMDAIRGAAADRGARVLLTGENGNWSISAAPYTLLADYVREQRWRDWWREASTLARTRSARIRGIAANSFGPWIPDMLWGITRRFSSRAEASAYTAAHPRLAGLLAEQRERHGVGLARRPKDNFRETVAATRHYDFGDLRAGALAGWGVDERDPTADRRLFEFCLSLPIDMLLKDGVRRPLARAALSDRLPPVVLEEKRKGYQAADWHEGMTANLPAINALLEDIAANPLAASLLDIPTLRQWVRDWPSGGWEQPLIMARYRNALLNALSAGHFILHASR